MGQKSSYLSSHHHNHHHKQKQHHQPDYCCSIEILSNSPTILYIRNVLTPEQCQLIISYAQPLLKPSKVAAQGISKDRTSSGIFLKEAQMNAAVLHSIDFDQHIHNIIQSACKLANKPDLLVANTTQIVEYKPRQFYRLHRDNDPGSNDEHINRHATFILYLNSLDRSDGGQTSFPFAIPTITSSGCSDDDVNDEGDQQKQPGAYSTAAAAAAPSGIDQHTITTTTTLSSQQYADNADEQGISITPHQGDAILFWSVVYDSNGHSTQDLNAVHAAETVKGHTNKYIATKWCYPSSSLSSS